MTALELFRIIIFLLSVSSETTCNMPLNQATECWIINNETGTMAVLTPDGIGYERVPPLQPLPRSPIQEQAKGQGEQRTELPASGLATYYGDGVFPGVVRNQIRYGNLTEDGCPECIGLVALLWPGDLDRVVCIATEQGQYGPLWVVDSAAGQHRQALIEGEWVVDIQRSVWKELGFWDAPMPNVTVEECEL